MPVVPTLAVVNDEGVPSNLEQQHQREYFESQGEGPWIVLYEQRYESGSESFGMYCALSEIDRRDRALSDPGWDLSIGDGAPGFSQSWPNGERETTYHRDGMSREGVEPLILVREYFGVAPSEVEIDQQFRLFHNLRKEANGSFFKMNSDGTQTLAIKVEGEKVSVRTPLLRQYVAARQMDLLLFVDSVLWSSEPAGVDDEEYRSGDLVGVRHAGESSLTGDRYFTRYLATKVIAPGPLESCGIWPFELSDANYPEFIIGEDDLGKPVTFSCNPDLLANYFGANPQAPHYLTPVHFRRDVLAKYYSSPELYTVEDGHLRCASLWSIRIDNDHEDRVIVFLGDLGRDLPSAERDYWRGFMIAPDSSMSETNIRRSFFGQPTSPAAVDLQFNTAYVRANQAWSGAFGWPLFREPKEDDVYLLQRLRLPLNDSHGEFSEAIQLLAKLMSDAINEKEVQRLLPDRIEGEKGISKLERLLKLKEYPEADRDISFLRRVQELRSKVAAHLKGSDYERALERNLGDRRGIDAIRWLFDDGILFLRAVASWADEQSDGPT